jgi:hypothetical protein
MSAAGTAAGYLYASGRLTRRKEAREAQQPCQKRSYRTELAALSNAACRMSEGSGPLSVYICARCNAYHLTSKEPRL